MARVPEVDFGDSGSPFLPLEGVVEEDGGGEWGALNARTQRRKKFHNVPASLKQRRRAQFRDGGHNQPALATTNMVTPYTPAPPPPQGIAPSASQVLPDGAMPMSDRILRGPMKYSVFASTTPRFGEAKGRGDGSRRSPRQDRAGSRGAPIAALYDPDCGTKMSLRTAVATSGKRGWSLQSTVPRFAARKVSAAPGSRHKDHVVQAAIAKLPFYGECDAGRPYTAIDTTVNKTAMRYSSAFGSIPRFQPRKPATAAGRGRNRGGRRRGNTYSAALFRSSTSRWGGTTASEDTSGGATRAKNASTASRRLYMQTSSPRFGSAFRPTTSPALGPGTYNAKKAMRRSAAPQFSDAPRFTPRVPLQTCVGFPGVAAASFDRSSQSWLASGRTMNRTPRVTGEVKQALDQVYMTDTLHKTTLSTSVAKSPIKYSNMRNKLPRTATTSSFAMNCPANPFLHGAAERTTLGPGSYDPHTTNNGRLNHVSVLDGSRMSVEFESSVERFPAKPHAFQRSFLMRNDPSLVDPLARADYDVQDYRTMAGDIRRAQHAQQRDAAISARRKAAVTQKLSLRPSSTTVPTRPKGSKSRATLRQPSIAAL